MSRRRYGSADLNGYEWQDQVCVLFSACINDFRFFLVEEQKGLFEPVDGILGMSRDLDHFLGIDLGDKGPLLVDGLIDNDFI